MMRSPPVAPQLVAAICSRAKGGRAPPTFGGYPAQESFEPENHPQTIAHFTLKSRGILLH